MFKFFGRPFRNFFLLIAVSLYQSIIELPQFVRPDPMPPDPGLLDMLSSSKIPVGEGGASESSSPYLPYHLHPAASSTSLLYSNWLGTDHKNASHMFGLQGGYFPKIPNLLFPKLSLPSQGQIYV